MLHSDLCLHVLSVLDAENNFVQSSGQPEKRAMWLTEADLMARLMNEIFPPGNPNRLKAKLVGSGRASPVHAMHDLQFGYPQPSAGSFAIEGIYIRRIGAIKPTKGETLAGDLELLASYDEMHVVAFVTQTHFGYAKGTFPYRVTDLLGCNMIRANLIGLMAGIIVPTNASPIWELDCTIDNVTQPLAFNVRRTVCGLPLDDMWAIVWSNVV